MVGDVLALLASRPPIPNYSLLGFRATPQPPFKGGLSIGLGCAHSPQPSRWLGLFAELARLGLTVGAGRGETGKQMSGGGDEGDTAKVSSVKVLNPRLGYAPHGADGLALFSGSAYPRSL